MLLDDKQAAKFLGVAPTTMRVARCTKRGALADLPYVRLGRAVRYSIDDLQAYVAQNRVEPGEGRG